MSELLNRIHRFYTKKLLQKEIPEHHKFQKLLNEIWVLQEEVQKLLCMIQKRKKDGEIQKWHRIQKLLTEIEKRQKNVQKQEDAQRRRDISKEYEYEYGWNDEFQIQRSMIKIQQHDIQKHQEDLKKQEEDYQGKHCQ